MDRRRAEQLPRFRQLATPLLTDDRIVTATLDTRSDGTTDRSVQVWSVTTKAPLAAFETILDFGGQRLALCGSSERMVVVAAAWERHGICGYEATTGERLWQRKDLKHVQTLRPADGDAVAACFDMRPMHVLDLGAGRTIAAVRGVRRFWQSPYSSIGAAETSGHVALIGSDDWTIRWRVPVGGFALLDAAFAPDAILVSNTVDGDSGDVCSLYCLSLTGQLLWELRMPAETNVPWLGWDAEADEWLGIRQNVEKREPEMLMRWSRAGELASRVPVGHIGEHAILSGGRLIVTGRGDLWDTQAATIVGRLTPPPALS